MAAKEQHRSTAARSGRVHIPRVWVRIAAVALGCLAVLTVEIGTRVYAGVFAPEQTRTLLTRLRTDPNPTAAPMAPHPFLQYLYEPSEALGTPQGFHGELAYAKAAGTVRVACVGGSTTAGAWPGPLEQYLRERDPAAQYEALDFGVEGWSSTHSLVNFVLNVREFDPDYVVVHHAWNDRPSCRECTRGDQADTFVVAPGLDRTPGRFVRAALRHSEVARLIMVGSLRARAARVARDGPIATVRVAEGEDSFAPPQGLCREDDPMWLYRRNLRTMVELALADDIRPVLTTFPCAPGVDDELAAHVARCDEVVRELAAQHAGDVLLVDLAADFPGGHYLDFAHLDADGRRSKAERIGAAILAHRRAAQTPPAEADAEP